MSTTPAPASRAPRLALRVGIVGQRLTRLVELHTLDALAQRVEQILRDIRNAAISLRRDFDAVYAAAEPALSLISPLAEGSDQLVAERALALGYALQVPLPFERGAYVARFECPPGAPDPAEAFDRLIAAVPPESVLVLDGAPGDADAYLRVGEVVIRHSDILIAIWDGTPARGPGGTADVVHRALAQDVPVLWIHAEDPAAWGLAALLEDASAGAGGVVIRERSPAMIGLVTEIVSLPAKVASEGEPDAADDAAALSDDEDGDPNPLLDYLAPMRPPRTGRLFAALTALAALEWPGASSGAAHEDGANGTGLARLWQMPPSIPKEIVDQIERRIGAYYASADALGERFGDLYRNTFSWMYLLSPLAVLCALLAYFGRELAGASIPSIVWPLCGVAELAILVAIVHLYRQAHVWRFHERWIDYRTLAERLRHLAVLWPLGCPPRDARAGSATSHDERRFAWIDWYTRAVVREAGLFGAPMDAATLAHYRTLLFDRLIDEQVAYHAQVAARMERVYHNLHGLAKLLFGLSLLAALVHVLLDIASREAPAALHAALVIVAIVGPAVGAAVHGFLGQGDFWNLARRSARARAGLEALRQELRSGSEKTPLSSRALDYWAERAVETLQEEVATWRVFTRLRRITLG